MLQQERTCWKAAPRLSTGIVRCGERVGGGDIAGGGSCAAGAKKPAGVEAWDSGCWPADASTCCEQDGTVATFTSHAHIKGGTDHATTWARQPGAGIARDCNNFGPSLAAPRDCGMM